MSPCLFLPSNISFSLFSFSFYFIPLLTFAVVTVSSLLPVSREMLFSLRQNFFPQTHRKKLFDVCINRIHFFGLYLYNWWQHLAARISHSQSWWFVRTALCILAIVRVLVYLCVVVLFFSSIYLIWLILLLNQVSFRCHLQTHLNVMHQGIMSLFVDNVCVYGLWIELCWCVLKMGSHFVKRWKLIMSCVKNPFFRLRNKIDLEDYVDA